MTNHVRRITAAEHRDFLQSVAAPGSDFPTTVSFLQTPAWARVKPEWSAESLGFFAGTELVGAGLVLYRRLPWVHKVGLKSSLAYLPEGPVLDWSRDDVADHLAALTRHVKGQGAFAVRIGPTVVHQTWGPATIKAAIADPAIVRLSQAPADTTNAVATRLAHQLRSLGWQAPADGEGFSAGQPKFNFQVPLTTVDAETGEPRQLSADEVLAGMNQLWRRNIKKATKAGVVVSEGTRDDLAAFHTVYLETAARDHFTGRGLSYFETMWDALNSADDGAAQMRLYLAHHEGDLVAATTWVQVGRHCWYSYGASTTNKREVRGSNATQWRMLTDSLAAGGEVYDLRGITEGVAEDDPEFGLIQFKVGTGGQAVSYVGEWDLPLNWALYRAFMFYLERRAGNRSAARQEQS